MDDQSIRAVLRPIRGRSSRPLLVPLWRCVAEAPATVVITTLTALTGLVQFLHPSLVTSWRRDTAALLSGEWWRLITPMLVQGSGVFQYAFNLAGSALVGPSVERRYGSRALVWFYLAGGFAGIGLEYLVRPHEFGSGSSDAVAALVGALCCSVLLRRRAPGTPAAVYALYFPLSLLALRLAGPLGSTLIGALVAAATVAVLRSRPTEGLRQLMLIAIPVPALVLLVLLDSHGVGLAAGALLGAALSRRLAPNGPRRPAGDRNGVAVPPVLPRRGEE